MLTVNEVKREIDKAIKNFGEYNYYDKGPHEVMPLDVLLNKTKDMTGKEIADLLVEVRKHKYGDEFVSKVFVNLQEREDMEDLYNDARIIDLF